MKYIKTYEQNNIDINYYLFNNNTKLNLSDLKLTELPELPKDIIHLDCDNNNLTELPELPETLESFYCDINNLTMLPELPDTLEHLYCEDNNINELPKLTKGLEILYCFNNNLPYDNIFGYWEWFKEEHPDLWAAKQMGLY